MDCIIMGGEVLLPSGCFERRDVGIAGGCIVDPAKLQHSVTGVERIDAAGACVLPGMIDIHGDAFERDVSPRPGVTFPLDMALRAVDRQLLANGITTAFHGLTVSWEPGIRSETSFVRFLAVLAEQRSRLRADHRVQVRWETFALDAMEAVEKSLAAEPKPILAFNDHTTSTLQKRAAGTLKKLGEWASRAGVTPEAYLALVDQAATRAADVPAAIERVAAQARSSGVVLLSHDVRSVEERREWRALGCTVSEFPLVMEAASDARSAGEHVVLGAPNVVRGGSHTGALSAEEAIRTGLCTVLASDYHYPCMLEAVSMLVARDVLPLDEAWALVSSNVAAATGLGDRGLIADGMRGDLVIARQTKGQRIEIDAVFAAGRLTRY
ncbi:MAG: alpha-D-ribose 1-methylphosphonate 5-triphosphate diphosphatase [Hyphomicrobiaceae bacterium]